MVLLRGHREARGVPEDLGGANVVGLRDWRWRGERLVLRLRGLSEVIFDRLRSAGARFDVQANVEVLSLLLADLHRAFMGNRTLFSLKVFLRKGGHVHFDDLIDLGNVFPGFGGFFDLSFFRLRWLFVAF